MSRATTLTDPAYAAHHPAWGRAWIALSLAFMAHVADEAANDFLGVYNPNAQLIRERTGIPVPVLAFEVFVGGLLGVVAVLLLLSPFAYRGRRPMRPLSLL